MQLYAYISNEAQKSYYLNKLPKPPPPIDFVILSGVMLLSLGSLALFTNFCNKPGNAPAIAPVIIGDKPNLLARLPTNPPSIALVRGLPDEIPFLSMDNK